MAASKLTLYNGALQLLKERPLASLSENRQPRRDLDSAWDRGAVRACLEDGQWRFSARTVMLDASPSIEPDFGLQYAFDKPTDFVRLIGIWSDENLSQPLGDYREEAGFWFSSIETIFVKYVSEDTSYGLNYSQWPQSFVELVEAHLAASVAGSMTEAGKELLQLRERRLHSALSKDSMKDPTQFPPAGNWVRSRGGSSRENGRLR